MRREIEFEAYLKNEASRKNSKNETAFIKNKLKYCRYAEETHGKDMEDIVASQANMDAAMCDLQKKYKPNSFAHIRAAVQKYKDFASSTRVTGWRVIPSGSAPAGAFNTYAGTAGLVVYENSVRSYEKDAGLCAFLETEYDKIRKFAETLLGKILQDFPAIPVFLSKECPVDIDLYRERLWEDMRKFCKKCDREICRPPECPAFHLLREMQPDTIAGRYFSSTEPQIVLYFRKLSGPWKMSNPAFTAKLAKTLAHEYLHFLHDYYVKSYAKTAVSPFDDEILSEALADFFGVLYAAEQGYISVANDRYRLWKRREGTGWSYAYALKFLPNPYKTDLMDYTADEMKDATKKFREVFQNTLDPKTAIKMLKA